MSSCMRTDDVARAGEVRLKISIREHEPHSFPNFRLGTQCWKVLLAFLSIDQASVRIQSGSIAFPIVRLRAELEIESLIANQN